MKVDGHNFVENGRCWYCGMRYDYYLDIKKASEEQPKRQDLKEWMKCAKTPKNKESEG